MEHSDDAARENMDFMRRYAECLLQQAAQEINLPITLTHKRIQSARQSNVIITPFEVCQSEGDDDKPITTIRIAIADKETWKTAKGSLPWSDVSKELPQNHSLSRIGKAFSQKLKDAGFPPLTMH